MSYELPSLPYTFNALEPSIDALTVEIHYTKHHMAYLKTLNTALEKFPDLAEKPVDFLLSDLSRVPEEIRTAVKNNGGGYYNHNLYWNIMGPNAGGEPVGNLARAITQKYGDFAKFKQELEKGGLSRFGSGWAWLSKAKDGSLTVHSTPNQDTPLAEGNYPIIGVDVWEHAYYLKYQNRRAEYLSTWWNVVNWKEAEKRYNHG
jgi:Fe-Mn family superoxide dismutase